MFEVTPARPGLSPALRRVLGSRFVAGLSAPHGIDRYLEAINPLWSVNEVRAHVVAVDRKTADSVTLTLRPNSNWQGFQPGQYVRLSVEIDGVQRMRCYSPADSIHRRDGLLELTAKAHPQGQVSQYLFKTARAGMMLTLSQAEGSFALPAERPQNILLISGGSGITPVMSMLRTLCDEGFAGSVTFLHYAFTQDDLIYGDELAEIAARHPNVRLLRAYTTQESGGELHGFFGRDHLAAIPGYDAAETFLCGPPGLMKSVQAIWAEDGIAERLHLEHFTAAALPTPSTETAGGEVRFTRAERYVENDGRTLLDQAESAGLKPQAGCRIGICHTCKCRKVSGQVRDVRTGALSDAGQEDIQICVSVPVGTVTLEI